MLVLKAITLFQHINTPESKTNIIRHREDLIGKVG